MPQSVLLDVGPLVAALRLDEVHHAWAVSQFQRFSHFLTCEAVLAEACARLNYYGEDQTKVVGLVTKGAVVVDFDFNGSADRIERLMKKYADRPMDLADACLVAMCERSSDCVVVTLDATDFKVYRRHDRQVIPFLSP